MSYNKDKIDATLGQEIHQHLLNNGVETPMVKSSLSMNEKLEIIETNVRNILETLGLDLSDDSLMDTPRRVAKMYVKEVFWGLDFDAFPKATAVSNKINYDEMVIENDINVQSNCEHHLVCISGYASVAYIPQGKVLGLSKLNRVVEYFCKRPQIQERLTEQVYHALQYILGTDDIAVLINAQHYCVKSRGVEDVGSYTITSKLGGVFKEKPEVRAEFMTLMQHKRPN